MRCALRRYETTLIVISSICAFGGITTWIVFPIMFPAQIAAHLRLEQNADTSLGYSAFMWSHPPMKNIMSFYFFNVTNPDEMVYHGARPMINQVGPFAVRESEEKKYMKWTGDKTQVFYENYKRYNYANEYSCEGCSFDDIVTIPNPTEVGAVAAIFDPQYNVSPTGRTVVAIALLLMGEYPFVSASVGDILFNGYEDALLSAYHSNFMNFLNAFLNDGNSLIPIPVPDMPRMGFFQGYNNSQDSHYWVKTGTDQIDNIGEVVTWGDVTSLPTEWWTTEYSRSIRGTDSGSFCKTKLTKEDVIPMFQSFLCRSFDKEFLEEATVHSIPSLTYSVPYEQYDTTSEMNKGFRYRNVEKVNYYPSWPQCPTRNSSNCDQKLSVDCSIGDNFCDDCCQGSFVDGTYLVPPGIYPLVCYPGRLQVSPFSVMASPPHFLYSPKQMIDSVYGLNPDINKHRPMMYSHEPTSGTVTKVIYQLQISIPISKSDLVTQNMHISDSIVPMFWQGARAELFDFTYNKLYFGFVLVPKIVDVIKYFLIVLSIFLLALATFCFFRRTRTRKHDSELDKLVL